MRRPNRTSTQTTNHSHDSRHTLNRSPPVLTRHGEVKMQRKERGGRKEENSRAAFLIQTLSNILRVLVGGCERCRVHLEIQLS